MQEQKRNFFLKELFTTLTTRKVILIIIGFGLLIYFNSLFNGFVGDDIEQIVNNPSIHSISNSLNLFTQGTFYDQSGQANNYYKPLLSFVFSLIYAFSAQSAFYFHLFQVLIHIADTILIFFLLSNFFKKQLSFLLSLIFLIHPLNVESVAYISALQEPLFLFFGLLALLLYLKNKPSNIFLKFTLMFFLLFCSLLSKETAIAFILLIPLISYLYKKKYLLQSIITCVLSLLVYLFFRLGLAHISFTNSIPLVPIQTLPLGERLLSIPKIILFYLKTFIYPVDLITFQTWTVKSLDLINFYCPLLIDSIFFIIFIAIGKVIFKKKQDIFRFFLFFCGWFIIGLTLHLQIIPLDETVADRWFYFSMVGLLGMIGAVVAYFGVNNIFKKWILVAVFTIILLFSVRVVIRNMDWKNPKSLYTHDSILNPTSHQLEIGLGGVALSEGNKLETEKDYIRATELFPSHNTFLNLAGFYLQNNDSKKAVVAYSNGLSYFDKNAFSWAYFGIAKYNAGDKKGAIVAIKKAYSLLPNNSFLVILHTMEDNDPIVIQQ